MKRSTDERKFKCRHVISQSVIWTRYLGTEMVTLGRKAGSPLLCTLTFMVMRRCDPKIRGEESLMPTNETCLDKKLR